MMFRYYGIPARYVEGYLLTPKDVEKKTSGKAIAIPQKNAHSWTEIYIDGYGWVPVEVCSPYYGLMPEADLQKGLESASFLKPFQLPEQYRRELPIRADYVGKNIPTSHNETISVDFDETGMLPVVNIYDISV